MMGPGRRHMRLLRAAEEVRLQPLPDNHARIYAARQLVQATLPHREPQGVPPEWSRTNGNYTLSIRPGYRTDPKTGKRQCIGYPYGSIPRLLLFWMTTEAVLTKSRKLPLGATLAEFMRELGLDPSRGGKRSDARPSRGGKRSDARRLQDQMERLFRATISFEYHAISDGRERSDWLDMQVAAKGHLWWDLSEANQLHLFESYIELSEEFYQAITAHPVPADMRALKVLKQSPLALDLYAWVTYRAHRVNQAAKPVTVTWRQLQQQLGADFSDNREFARKLKGALAKVLALYPHLRIEVVRGGLQIYPGPSLTLLP